MNHQYPTAKEKLNASHYNAAIVWAIGAGVVTQSILVAALVFGAIVALRVSTGDIRG